MNLSHLRQAFNSSAVRKAVVALSAAAALTGGSAAAFAAGDDGTQQSPQGTYTLRSDAGERLASVEFRACAKDLCIYVTASSAAAKEKLGIPVNATNQEVVHGLKSDNHGGFKDGEIVNASSLANGADVNIKPSGTNGFDIKASKLLGSMKGKLEPERIQLASNAPTPK